MIRVPTMEERHLAESDRYIAEGEGRLARQAEIVERLLLARRDASVAKEMFWVLLDALDGMYAHRRLLVRSMEGGKPAFGRRGGFGEPAT